MRTGNTAVTYQFVVQARGQRSGTDYWYDVWAGPEEEHSTPLPSGRYPERQQAEKVYEDEQEVRGRGNARILRRTVIYSLWTGPGTKL